MGNREEVFAARHFGVLEARSLDRAGQFCRSTSDQNAVANIGEQGSGAFVLHWPGVPDPDAVVTTVGLGVVKNTRKNTPPIPNKKRLRNCFILAPTHFPVRAGGTHQLKRQLAFREQADFRECCPLRAPAP